jgi:Ser/Thr protein kinase RdoA (MazF antagonist)
MTGELFQPNNLSAARPAFVPLEDPAVEEEVRSVLEDVYGLPCPANAPVFRLAGEGFASRGFRVELPEGAVFLKSRPGPGAVEDLAQEAARADRLGGRGVPMARAIPARDGGWVGFRGGAAWALYGFVEGDYFSGAGGELYAAARVFGQLMRAASDLGPADEAGAPAFWEELEGLVEAGARQGPGHDGVADLCRAHGRTIAESLARVREARALLEGERRVVHLDYHPLNLLMKDGAVAAVVDLEVLWPYPVLPALGFAAYKLIRQMMLDPGVRERERAQPALVERWLAGWRAALPKAAYRPEELGLGARYRALALIHLILDACLRRDDHAQDYDLAKQVRSLYEIDLIFAAGRAWEAVSRTILRT